MKYLTLLSSVFAVGMPIPRRDWWNISIMIHAQKI